MTARFSRHASRAVRLRVDSEANQAQGSGFAIDEGSYVVTNNPVIDGADEIVVAVQDGQEFPATLVGTDQKTDIALLKIDGHGSLPSVGFGDFRQSPRR